MTPDEIRSHPYFSKLTDKQQVFVDALMSNGNDKVAAAKAAWKCSNDDSARTQANRAMRHEGIAYLVEAYFGKDPSRLRFTKDSALEFAAKQARADGQDPKLALDYLRLIVQMEGWQVKAADNDKPKPADNPNEDFSLD